MTNITVHAGATGFDLYSNKGAFHYHYNYRTHVTQITKLTQHYSGTEQVTVGKVSVTYYHISSKFGTKLKIMLELRPILSGKYSAFELCAHSIPIYSIHVQ